MRVAPCTDHREQRRVGRAAPRVRTVGLLRWQPRQRLEQRQLEQWRWPRAPAALSGGREGVCKLPVSSSRSLCSSRSSRSSLPPSFLGGSAEQVVGAPIRSLEALQDQVGD